MIRRVAEVLKVKVVIFAITYLRILKGLGEMSGDFRGDYSAKGVISQVTGLLRKHLNG